MLDAFKCVTQVTGGTLTIPRTLKAMLAIPLPGFDLWRYVVLTTSFVTLLLAARILYRHSHHVWGWGTGQATLAGGLLLTLGALSVYLVLFAEAGMVTALLGLAVLIGLFLVAWHRQTSHPAPLSSRSSPWTLSLLLAGGLLLPRPSFAAESLPANCARVVHGPARYHHVLALDVSGSVLKHLSAMKGLLACYADMYTLPNEEVSLIVFGYDHTGMGKELRTFTVPPDGSTAILKDLLNDLELQDPKSTRTYFRPLADYLQQFLQRVRLQPVVLVVSDGQSDAHANPRPGLLPRHEIPFASFGKRGVYSAPGMHGWQVAIAGGSGLDLTALFQKSVAPARKPQVAASPSTVLERCLLDPELLVETDNRLVLQPRWNPFARVVDGQLTLRVRNECVARFRSFTVQLRRGDETLRLGRVAHTLIDQNPRTFTFPMLQPRRSIPWAEATVQVILDQGGSTRAIYPQPSVVTLAEVSYWSAFGLHGAVLGAVLLLVGGLAVFTIRQRRVQEHNRPEVVKVLGGSGVPLARGQAATIGGEGCALAVPGVASGVVLGLATWTGDRGVLTFRPEDGFRLKVNGVDVDGVATYHIGQPLQFVNAADGTTYNVTLYPGSTRDIGFGTATLTAGQSAPFAGGPYGFGDGGLSTRNGVFGAIPGTADGHGSDSVAYI